MDDQTNKPEPLVGKPLTARVFALNNKILDDYYKGLALTMGDPGIIPATLASGPDNTCFAEIDFRNDFGHLWIRQEREFMAPLESAPTGRWLWWLTRVFSPMAEHRAGWR